jgi:ribonuclease PH
MVTLTVTADVLSPDSCNSALPQICAEAESCISFLPAAMDAVMNEAEIPPFFQGTGTGTDAAPGIATGTRAGRRDGRAAGAMRELSVTQGTLQRADGSARLRVGLTDVLVAVYGPMDCPVHRQLADRAEVHVSYRQREVSGAVLAAQMGSRVSAAEAVASRNIKDTVLQSVLAVLNPRKAIAVGIHVLSDDGGAIAAAINATFLALIDAGVPMQSVLTAGCISILNGTALVDPVAVEEVEADAVLTFTFNTKSSTDTNLVAMHTNGDCESYELFQTAAVTALDVATSTRAFLQLAVKGSINTK